MSSTQDKPAAPTIALGGPTAPTEQPSPHPTPALNNNVNINIGSGPSAVFTMCVAGAVGAGVVTFFLLHVR